MAANFSHSEDSDQIFGFPEDIQKMAIFGTLIYTLYSMYYNNSKTPQLFKNVIIRGVGKELLRSELMLNIISFSLI